MCFDNFAERRTSTVRVRALTSDHSPGSLSDRGSIVPMDRSDSKLQDAQGIFDNYARQSRKLESLK